MRPGGKEGKEGDDGGGKRKIAEVEGDRSRRSEMEKRGAWEVKAA